MADLVPPGDGVTFVGELHPGLDVGHAVRDDLGAHGVGDADPASKIGVVDLVLGRERATLPASRAPSPPIRTMPVPPVAGPG